MTVLSWFHKSISGSRTTTHFYLPAGLPRQRPAPLPPFTISLRLGLSILASADGGRRTHFANQPSLPRVSNSKVSCGCRGSALVRPFPGHTRSLLGIYRDPPLLLTLAWRTSDAQTTNCVLCVSSHKANWTPSRRPQPPATPVSSPLIFELRRHTSWPSCCSRPRPRPSNTAAVTALPLLFLVLLLAHAFLREARQEGPLVPPTLPWQVELSEGPPPAPPLLRRRPHNKTHFPLHRLFIDLMLLLCCNLLSLA